MKLSLAPLLLLIAAASLAGCANSPGPVSRPLRERLLVPAQLGPVGVVSFSSAETIAVVMPQSRREAVESALDSARFIKRREFDTVARSVSGVPMGGAVVLAAPVVVPLFSTVRAGVGAAYNYVAAEPEARLAQPREVLVAASSHIPLERQLREQLVDVLGAQSPLRVVNVDNALVRHAEPRLREHAWRHDAEIGAKTLAALEKRGIRTALELRLQSPALIGAGALSPELAFTARIRIRLVDTATGQELYRDSFEYRGAPRSYATWASDGGSLLREETARCVSAVGTRATGGIAARCAPRAAGGLASVR